MNTKNQKNAWGNKYDAALIPGLEGSVLNPDLWLEGSL